MTKGLLTLGGALIGLSLGVAIAAFVYESFLIILALFLIGGAVGERIASRTVGF